MVAHIQTKEQRALFERWLEGRPEVVQRLARIYEPGCQVHGPNETWQDARYVVGYTEDGGLLVSKTSPYLDYHKAMAEKEKLCAECVPDLLQLC